MFQHNASRSNALFSDEDKVCTCKMANRICRTPKKKIRKKRPGVEKKTPRELIDGSRAESGRLGPTTFRYFFFQKFFFQGRPESGRVEKTRPDSKKSRPESGRVEFFLVFFFGGFFFLFCFFLVFFFLEKILLWGGRRDPSRADSARLGLTRADSGRVFFFDSGRLFFFFKFFFRLGPSRPDF